MKLEKKKRRKMKSFSSFLPRCRVCQTPHSPVMYLTSDYQKNITNIQQTDNCVPGVSVLIANFLLHFRVRKGFNEGGPLFCFRLRTERQLNRRKWSFAVCSIINIEEFQIISNIINLKLPESVSPLVPRKLASDTVRNSSDELAAQS